MLERMAVVHSLRAADPDGHVWEFAWNPFSPLGLRENFSGIGLREAA